MVICPSNLECSNWAKVYVGYCLCSARDGISLSLGLLSVISWGFAEIPQIITNYKHKSAEGLSFCFLFTWVVGDLFNLLGCLLEPATLYMANTLIILAQTIYYGHIFPRLKSNRWEQKGIKPNQNGMFQENKANYDDAGRKLNTHVGRLRSGSSDSEQINGSSSPIPFATSGLPHSGTCERDLYYTSARRLSSSYTPTAGSFLAQRASPSKYHDQRNLEEPLLSTFVSESSASPSKTKTMLITASALLFVGGFSYQSTEEGLDKFLREENQASGGAGDGSSGIGTFLGWAMAAIYMGGRLPQICLNGLNPFMFIFALIGNGTYVASILVNSLDWSKIRPNLPWLVDAAGCVLLDTFIVMQFIYFYHVAPQDEEIRHENLVSA
ncbi:PQ-loop repeat [Dillenia turbinata]|uniref:PQ-loop repeat n=1 Tax=Dillenia turbinata TaxID=194707 RepID=A0AAN8W5Q0_9MAGN